MSIKAAKRVVRSVLRRAGIEIRRLPVAVEPRAIRRNSIEGILRHTASVGFHPATVIDVGAAFGDFTSLCHRVFPSARYIMLDPLQEYLSARNQQVAHIPQAESIVVAAVRENGPLIINVHDDWVGTSALLEEEAWNNGKPREVPGITLDELLAGKSVSPPILLKIDVQGGEMDVLAGAEKTLHLYEMIILEAVFFKFFRTGPEFADIVSFMKSKGFVPYDVCDPLYRPLDGALSQVDVAFVREGGSFRRDHRYASEEQRLAHNRERRSERSSGSGRVE